MIGANIYILILSLANSAVHFENWYVHKLFSKLSCVTSNMQLYDSYSLYIMK